MTACCNKKIEGSKIENTPIHESGSHKTTRYITVALGIIILIGSLAASGLLYPQMGAYSCAIGAAGALLTLACFLSSYRCSSTSQAKSDENKPLKAYSYPERAEIFKETLKACDEGYVFQGKGVIIDHEPMLEAAVTFETCEPLEGAGEYQTKFSVVVDDTLNALINLKKLGHNPVGINMANRYGAGGGVVQGCPAQEESMCRRSNHVLGLKTQNYPFPDEGGIYTPHVQVFREDEAHQYAFMEQPCEVNLVAVAAYDLRSGSEERVSLGLPLRGKIEDATLESCELYKNKTQNTIRNMLRAMHSNGHRHLVLGAWGCGAFQNPPHLMAQLFLEVFQEAEFKGRFEQVDFAILELSPKDKDNISSFSTICNELNKRTELS